MKQKLPAYIIAFLLIAVPFKFAYLAPASSFFPNLFAFLSVLTGFLVLLIFGSNDNGHQAGH
jgi:uncharacterized membrane protein YdfJ with MMPL/SSD domain